MNEISLTSASPPTITQPRTSAQSCSICSHHNWTGILSDLFTRPPAATSSRKAPAKLLFFCLSVCGLWEHVAELCVKAARQISWKEVRNPCYFCTTLSFPAAHLFSQTHYLTLRLVSREKIKTMCPSFCLSCSQKGGAQISWSEIWKVLQTNAICRGCPNGV